MRIRGFRLALRPLALAAVLGASPALAATSALPATATTPSTACVGAVVHPISARVEALDPVRRGATVRLRVVASSLVGVSRAEARLVHPGTARALGATRAPLGALGRGSAREATFRVVVPQTGERALVQFKVEGEGPNGRLARGVVFNLLPDGPTETGRARVAADGTRLYEVEARTVAP